jgi:hypothetical protein
VVPGWPQWSWRQRERALALFGSFSAALAVGLFAWGTRPGWGFLAFAVATHVVSAADAIRQGAFPGFGRWVPVITASVGVALGYTPALVILGNLAWPVGPLREGRQGFLVNRWAYLEARPEAGHWVYYRGPAPSVGPGIGRLWARGGAEVEWIDGRLRVGGEDVDWLPPGVASPTVQGLLLRVPEGHVLVEPLDPAAGPWLVLPERAIGGRAWAQHEPIWARRLLR